jgi:hypothetical protein
MVKWEIKFNDKSVVPPIFILGKAEFSDCKVLGDVQKMLALMNNEVIYLGHQ